MNEKKTEKQIKTAAETETPGRLDDIQVEMQKTETPKIKRKHSFRFRLVVSISAALVVILGGFTAFYFFYIPPATGPLAGQIDKYYATFNATKYGDHSCPAPMCPTSYSDLLNDTYGGDGTTNPSPVVLCTVNDIGVFRNKNQRFIQMDGFGIYIYTVKINRILFGKASINSGTFIAVSESTYAHPKGLLEGKKIGADDTIKEWEFTPGTCRPKETKALEVNKQYVMFLSPKDETGCYPLSYNGFGVFSTDYIKKEAKTDSLTELESKYENTTTSNILYKICALRVEKDLLHGR